MLFFRFDASTKKLFANIQCLWLFLDIHMKYNWKSIIGLLKYYTLHKTHFALQYWQPYWCRGVVVITTAQLHSTKPELRFCAGSNPACSVSEIRDGEDLWQWFQLEIRLNAFRRSTIPQKKFLIIIIIFIIFSWLLLSPVFTKQYWFIFQIYW